jgi:RNA-binding protein
LQRLGRVVHVSQSRNIIIKLENIPKIGTVVVNENLKPVGKILDVFGPISSPYASIKPKIHETRELTEKAVYVLPLKKRREKM